MLTSKSEKIVVIGHEASLSGAPILLLHLFELVQKKRNLNILFAIHRDGVILDLYKRSFPVLLLKRKDYGKENNIILKIYNFWLNKIQLLKLCFHVLSSDYVFSNTIVNGKLLKIISVFRKPIITYVHELKSVIDLYSQLGDARFSLAGSNLFAYPSRKVSNTLEIDYNVSENKLYPLNYYFPFLEMVPGTDPGISLFFKEKFNIKEKDFVIGGMGFASPRKGTDLFVEVFNIVNKVNPEIKFCWVGDFEDLSYKEKVFQNIPEGALGKQIVFTGLLQHSYSNFELFDLFFLSSREDPYPLVVLEAAWMNKPSICFENSGGIPEFIEEDAGWCIDDFNVQSVAHLILELYHNRSMITIKGDSAHKKVLELHANQELILSQFDKILFDAKIAINR